VGRVLTLAALLTLASAAATARRSCQALGCPGHHRVVVPAVVR
jgi:hypothetical protein